MPIYAGTATPSGYRLGSSTVSAVYFGATQIYSGTPIQTTLANEQFTTNWTQWTKAKTGTFSIASGVGSIVPPAVNYQTARAVLTAISPQTDVIAHVEFMVPNLNEQYFDIGVRTQNSATANPQGYYASFYPAGGASDPNYSLLSSDGTYTANEQKQGMTYLANNWYALDIRVRGNRVTTRLWNMTAGQSQPFNYDLTMVDTPYSTGYLELGVTSGFSNLGRVNFRNVTVKTVVDEPGDTTPSSDSMPTATTVSSSGKTWTLSYTNDFTTNVAEGGFRTAYPGIASYAEEQGDTGTSVTKGRYSTNKTVSVVNNILTVNQRVISGVPYGAMLLPDNYAPHTYGRAQVRVRQTDVAGKGGFKFVGIWWPSSDNWADGEIDWPEADNGQVPRPATASYPAVYTGTNNDKRVFYPSIPVPADQSTAGWHVYTVDWAPDAISFYQDGKIVNRVSNTKGIPTKPMRFGLQFETWLGGDVVAADAVGKVEVDWVAIYNMN